LIIELTGWVFELLKTFKEETKHGYRGLSNILIPMLCNVMKAKHVRLNVCKTCMLIWLLLVDMTHVVVLFLFYFYGSIFIFFSCLRINCDNIVRSRLGFP
jgi:hypothetical protein